VDSYAFNIACYPDLLDVDIALTEAAALGIATGLAAGALLGLGLTAAFLSGGGALGVQGSTIRRACPATNYATAVGGKPAKPYSLCRDLQFQHFYAASLFMLIIDYGATTKLLLGNKSNLVDYYYFPQVTVLAYLSYYFLSNDILLLAGAGTCEGGILCDGSSGTIGGGPPPSNQPLLNAVTDSGPPVGNPELVGQISVGTRYDNLKTGVVGGKLNLSGIPFTAIPGAPITPNTGLFFGDELSTFTTNSDGSISAVIPPGFTKDYLTFRGTNGNVWNSRTPVIIQ
jgi:hypothetical protein